jgi:hypothetical protein
MNFHNDGQDQCLNNFKNPPKILHSESNGFSYHQMAPSQFVGI